MECICRVGMDSQDYRSQAVPHSPPQSGEAAQLVRGRPTRHQRTRGSAVWLPERMATCSESDFISHFPFLFKRAFNRHIEQCLPWWGQDFRRPVDPMLIPSGNTVINTPGNPASSHVPQLVKADTWSESYPGLWENCRKFWLSLAISLQLRQMYWRKCQFGRNGKNSLYIYFPYERSPRWCLLISKSWLFGLTASEITLGAY